MSMRLENVSNPLGDGCPAFPSCAHPHAVSAPLHGAPADRSNEVPVGYKRTEVGVIPSDWDVVLLGNLFVFKNGLNKAKQFFGTGTPIVNYMDVFEHPGIRINDLLGRVNLSHEEIRNFEVRLGDVFFTRTSETVEEIGAASVMLEEPCDTVFSGFVLRARPRDDRLDDHYKQYCFGSRATRSQIVSNATYTTRALTNGRSLSAVFVAVPPKPEQHAIAEALSDVDGLLTALDALIAKKRTFKRAAMEQLITGKTRLPGFSGVWEMKRLELIINCHDHVRRPLNGTQRGNMPGPYPYCGANGVLDYVNDFVIDDDVILIAEDGGFFDEYAHRPIAYRMKGKIWVNNHAHILKAKRGYSQGFLFYSLVHKNIVPYLASGTRAKLNKSEMNKIEINLPLHYAEQKAIASVLSDMDAEITMLERRREKTRTVKQSMLQQLLTGRVRLLNPAHV